MLARVVFTVCILILLNLSLKLIDNLLILYTFHEQLVGIALAQLFNVYGLVEPENPLLQVILGVTYHHKNGFLRDLQEVLEGKAELVTVIFQEALTLVNDNQVLLFFILFLDVEGLRRLYLTR